MGKVHGSLARAGKVKSATPKASLMSISYLMSRAADSPLQVDTAEKPKTPKGRAHKRAVYTRRFVNVTMTGGKRRV